MLRTSLVAVALFAVACSPKGKAPLNCSAEQSICQPATGDAYCTALAQDTNNCGACGNVCDSPIGGQVRCSEGQCQFNCGGGFGAASTKTVCGVKGQSDGGTQPYCTDLATDHENCGACGKACGAQEACVNSQCTVNGTTACSAAGTGTIYVDLDTDRANCGACGNACAAGEVCSGGSCQGCPVAQCNNACTDTQRDPANCGACGNAAPPGSMCEAGTIRSGLISIEPVLPLTAPTGPSTAVSATFAFSVKVHAQSRVASVTYSVNGGAATAMGRSGSTPLEMSPTLWTASTAVPAGATWTLTITAADEQYFANSPDPSHITTLTTTLTPKAAPTTTPLNLGVTAGGNAVGTGTACSGPCKWVPLNAGQLTLSAQVPGGTTDASGILFRSNGAEIGRADLSGGNAQISALPADVGTGDVSVTACTYDQVGQIGPCAAAVTFTVGRIANTGVAMGRDVGSASGAHTIYYVHSDSHLYAQDWLSLNASSNALPGQGLGTLYKPGSLYATPEGAGVYVVKADGTAVDRVQCNFNVLGSGCVKSNFVVPQTGGFASITGVTNAAMLVVDGSGNGAFALANPAQTSDTAVPAGGVLTPAGGFETTRAGAMAGWFVNGSNNTFSVFDPSASVRLIQPVVNKASLSAFALDVMPGGEIIYQYRDPAVNGGSVLLGAVFLNGSGGNTQLAPQQIGPNGGSVFAKNFVVVKPGVVLAEIPNATVGSSNDAALINLNGTPSLKDFPAATVAAVGTGTLIENGVYTRNFGLGAFGVSDDKTKALYVSKDPTGASTPQTFHVHLIDIAAATDTTIGSGDNLLAGGYAMLQPHFVHSAPPYAGGAPAGTHQVAIWYDRQVQSGSAAHFRVSYLNYATGSGATVDRLATGFVPQGVQTMMPEPVESPAQGAVLFATTDDLGGYDLYSAPLNASATARSQLVATRIHNFFVREDTARLIVSQASGLVSATKLSAGSSLAAALQPVVDGGPTGDVDLWGGATMTLSGFTPDGDHLYVVRGSTLNVSTLDYTGPLETVDLNTGAHVNWGQLSQMYATSGTPAGFIGGTTAAMWLSPTTQEAPDHLFVTATAANPTAHKDAGLGLVGQISYFAPIVYSISVDGTEGFLSPYGSGNWSAAFERDGSTTNVTGNSEVTLLPATYSPFGGAYRPNCSQLNFTSGNKRSLFKLWGGANPAPFVTLLRGGNANASSFTRETPDNAEYLYVYASSADASSDYAYALALNGRPAPTLPLP